MDWPSSSHLFYIPGILLIGMFLGFMMASRVKQDFEDLHHKQQEKRALARQKLQKRLNKQND